MLPLFLAAILFTTGSARAADPPAAEIHAVEAADGKVSIRAQAVPLGQLLRQLDAATGMTSRVVSKELENRKISVRFSNLDYAAAVRKIFQGQALDYVFIREQGIIVTAIAQAVGTATPTPAATSAEQERPSPFLPPSSPAPMMDPAAAAANSGAAMAAEGPPRPLPSNAPLALPGGGLPGEDTPLLPFAALPIQGNRNAVPALPAPPRSIETAAVQTESSPTPAKKPK